MTFLCVTGSNVISCFTCFIPACVKLNQPMTPPMPTTMCPNLPWSTGLVVQLISHLWQELYWLFISKYLDLRSSFPALEENQVFITESRNKYLKFIRNTNLSRLFSWKWKPVTNTTVKIKLSWVIVTKNLSWILKMASYIIK